MGYGATIRRRRYGNASKPACSEPLEQRVLLSVSDAQYAAIRASYSTFELPAEASQTNIIEIAASKLSITSLAAAIKQAATTTRPDLIILRTTDTQNRITFDKADSLYIDFPSSRGSINIISLGTKPVTIKGPAYGVLGVGSGHGGVSLGLGGMVLTGGGHKWWDALSQRGGRLAMKGVTLRDGGGLSASNCAVRLDKVTFQNDGTQVNGGLLLVDCDSTLNNVTIQDNSSAFHGGGMEQVGGVSTLTNVTIARNTTGGAGGGILFNYATSSLNNVLIVDNAAGGKGGGIATDGSHISLTNVTVSGNRAPSGGGIYHGLYGPQGSLILNKSVVALNTARIAGNDAYLASNAVSSDLSLIGDFVGDLPLGHGLPGTDPALMKVKVGYYGSNASAAPRSSLVLCGASVAGNIRLTVINGYLLWSSLPQHRPPVYGARPLCQVAPASAQASSTLHLRRLGKRQVVW